MLKTVDARGQSCPIPLMLARDAYRALQPGDTLEVLVGEPVARDNVTRFLRNQKCQPTVSETAEGWKITVVR